MRAACSSNYAGNLKTNLSSNNFTSPSSLTSQLSARNKLDKYRSRRENTVQETSFNSN